MSIGRATAPILGDTAHDFCGEHQSGIVTEQQDRLHFAAFDLTTDSRDRVIALLRRWTQAAATLMTGSELGAGAAGGPGPLPPDDTGEALGLPAAGLTITFGFGRTMFTKDGKDGKDRFGLEGTMPGQLQDRPHLAGDATGPAFEGGDLCIQACAHDPLVAIHAIRNLARFASGDASVGWAQLGFGRTSSTTRTQSTSRNLMGFKDGMRNLRAEDTNLVTKWLWADPTDGPQWVAGGTYLVVRKIRIHAEVWDPRAQYVPIQEEISRADRMTTEYLKTVGTALFAVPPGVPRGAVLGEGGAFVGQSLLG